MDRKAVAISVVVFGIALMTIGLGCSDKEGPAGATGAAGPAGSDGATGQDADADDGYAVEACLGCHGPGGEIPVADITDPRDAHYTDTDPDGPLRTAGYRKFNVTLTSVDVTGTRVVMEFGVLDENGSPVTNLFAADGRFTLARLRAGASAGDPSFWRSLITRIETPPVGGGGPGTPTVQGTSESFSATRFVNLGSGNYRYSSGFNPQGPIADATNTPVVAGDVLRLAIQLSASDIPAGNGWCDFTAPASPGATGCSSPVATTRDIVQTATCNTCHGATSDVKLALHGGGRTDVEYCVTCHNPYTTDSNTGNTVNFPVLVHKIHAGATLANGYTILGNNSSVHDYSTVGFVADLDNCTRCHNGGGSEESNWRVPNREACGSCHDDVNFATGANHGSGGVQTSNAFCQNCHPATGPITASLLPVATVHKGLARNVEAARYAGASNGFLIENISLSSGTLTVQYSVTRDGVKQDLAAAPEWTAPAGASRLAVAIGWNTLDYTNRGSATSTPAQPVSINALPSGGVATNVGVNVFQVTAALPTTATASQTITAVLEGHPAADLTNTGATFSDRIAVVNDFMHFNTGTGRSTLIPRREVVDVDKCNKCHDAGGQGISLHGNNRTSEIQVCVVCHNPDATDIARRPADPTTALDGKKEQEIDFKRLIHMIHSGAELESGLVVYGFGNAAIDFSTVEFIGNRQNCETCHLPGTYGAENAWDALPSTVDTGADRTVSTDDLNISPVAAVCSACHDGEKPRGHMIQHDASFKALDVDIN